MAQVVLEPDKLTHFVQSDWSKFKYFDVAVSRLSMNSFSLYNLFLFRLCKNL